MNTPLFSGEGAFEYQALHDALVLAAANYALTIPEEARRGTDEKSAIYQFVEETPATSLVVELIYALHSLGKGITPLARREVTASPELTARDAPVGSKVQCHDLRHVYLVVGYPEPGRVDIKDEMTGGVVGVPVSYITAVLSKPEPACVVDHYVTAELKLHVLPKFTGKADVIDWPTDEGIWMGNLAGDWFPLQTLGLRDDLPSPEELAREDAGEVMPPRPILAITAQWPKSKDEWPFLFKGNHPVKEWRRPTDDELQRAKHCYGLPVAPSVEQNDARDTSP